MLDEMDAVFGVSALLEAEQAEARARAYSAGQLRGLRVAHDLDSVSTRLMHLSLLLLYRYLFSSTFNLKKKYVFITNISFICNDLVTYLTRKM